MPEEIPEYLFKRQDESADENFYAMPRFVNHIDDETILRITEYYRETLKPSDELLDLMSSWVSHLPEEISYVKVTGLGMNEEELAANPRLDASVVHNLNDRPELPFAADSFDAVLIVVSIQYLTSPFEVFKSIRQVLKDGGSCVVAMSHRLFPTKAIYAFQAFSHQDRVNLVMHYMRQAGFTDIEFIDRSPDNADPIWIVRGVK